MVNISPIRKTYEEKLRALDLDKGEEMKTLDQKYAHLRQVADQGFYSQAAVSILESVKSDYEILQGRSKLASLGIDDETLDAAMKIHDVLKGVKKRDSMPDLVDIVGQIGGDEMKAAVRGINAGMMTKQDVFSYMATDSSGVCYLLTPVKSGVKKNKIIARELEGKVDGILDEKKVFEERTTPNPTPAAIGTTRYLEFSTELNVNKDFLVYTIKAKNPTESERLEIALTKKIEELQPKAFDKSKLTHRVLKVEFGVINYLLSNSERTLYEQSGRIKPLEMLEQFGESAVPIDEVARITGLTTRGVRMNLAKKYFTGTEEGIEYESVRKYLEGKKQVVSGKNKLKFESSDLTERKMQALRILEAKKQEEDIISTSELAKALGMGASNLTTNLRNKISGERRGLSVYWDVASAMDFVQTHTPSNKGWIKEKKK